MSKLQSKKLELNRAIAGIEAASAKVKKLSEAVKKGALSPKELENAIFDLKRKGSKLKIIHAETKILSGYEHVPFNDVAPKTDNQLKLWVVIALIALLYIVLAK